MRDRTGTKADLQILTLVNDAVNMVSMSHNWNWLITQDEIAFVAGYDTGTVAITNGSSTLTLTTGVWPSWAASGEVFLNGRYYRVLTRDSDTQLTLEGTWVYDAITAETYVIYQDSYSLPADLFKLHKFFQGRNYLSGCENVDIITLLDMKDGWQSGSTYTRVFTVHQNKLLVWPYPSAAGHVNLSYYRRPTAMTDASDTLDFDPNYITLIYRAIDLQVALQFGDAASGLNPERCQEVFKAELARATAQNGEAMQPKRPLGGNRRHSRHQSGNLY